MPLFLNATTDHGLSLVPPASPFPPRVSWSCPESCPFPSGLPLSSPQGVSFPFFKGTLYTYFRRGLALRPVLTMLRPRNSSKDTLKITMKVQHLNLPFFSHLNCIQIQSTTNKWRAESHSGVSHSHGVSCKIMICGYYYKKLCIYIAAVGAHLKAQNITIINMYIHT